MAQYDYICRATGERQSIIKPMRDAPPAVFEDAGKRWERDWGDVKGHVGRRGEGPRFRGRPIENIAFTLPPNESPYVETTKGGIKIREHADGTCSDEYGHRIIEGEKAMHKTCEQLGKIYEPNA
jgi:hypothetical protein